MRYFLVIVLLSLVCLRFACALTFTDIQWRSFDGEVLSIEGSSVQLRRSSDGVTFRV